MKLSQCTIGTLVKEKRIPGDNSTDPLRIGHVVGLEVNSVGETIPVIQLAGRHGDTSHKRPIHHSNLNPLED